MNIRMKKWLGITTPSALVLAKAEIENRRRVNILAHGFGFRDYERPEGVRGTKDLPEYRVTDFWAGQAVDEGFTFSRLRADAMMDGGFEQAYDVELHVRTDGDWRLVERREQSAATPDTPPSTTSLT